ncbi:hypothetical protein DV737_g3267, partial [Chaetothyriales sp. CBS 132003]
MMASSPTKASSAEESLHNIISKSIDNHEEHLADICKKIHDDPEFNYREFHAHDNICDLLERLGYQVKRHTYGLETSFEAESGHGGRLVVFNAEYDALPGIGHACGHNLIATSSIAAFIATAEALRNSGSEGRVRLLGTPAEEGGGGKVRLIREGAYVGVDACLMAHPMGCMPTNHDGIASARSLARRQVMVTFQGRNAHAGFSPWNGKNALDAVVASYVNISLLRQQLPTTARVHGVVRKGGAEPNIIPDSTSLEYYLRGNTFPQVEELSGKLQACFEAGALATGCKVDCAWQLDNDYKDLCPNAVLSREFTRHMHAFGRDYLEDGGPDATGGGSTDMGNVSYEVPGFHCAFSVGTTEPTVQPHTPEFTAAAGTKLAFERTLDCAKGMAATAYDLLVHSDLMEEDFVVQASGDQDSFEHIHDLGSLQLIRDKSSICALCRLIVDAIGGSHTPFSRQDNEIQCQLYWQEDGFFWGVNAPQVRCLRVRAQPWPRPFNEFNRLIALADDIPGLDGHFFGRQIKETPPINAKRIKQHIVDALDQSVYESRAWTYQESCLSRRCLFFFDNQVTFRCRSALWREDVYLENAEVQTSFDMIFKHVISGITATGEAHSDYIGSLYEYSSRQITYESDVLNAFAGVLGVLCERMRNGGRPEVDHAYGLPTHVFDWAILWQPNLSIQRQSKMWPSWSWCGWTGTISMALTALDDSQLESWLRSHTWINWIIYGMNGQPLMQIPSESTYQREEQVNLRFGHLDSHVQISPAPAHKVQALMRFSSSASSPSSTGACSQLLHFATLSLRLRLIPTWHLVHDPASSSPFRSYIIQHGSASQTSMPYGTIRLSSTWPHDADPERTYEFVVLSEAPRKSVVKNEFPPREFASRSECEIEAEWAAYFVMLIERGSQGGEEEVAERSELPAFILGALTSVGGIIGYARTGSYGLGGYRIQKKQVYGIELALLASVILAGSSIPRAIRLGKPLPIGLSVLATTGLLVYGRALLAARG